MPLVYQLATFNVNYPFLTQPYVWSPAHGDVITWPPCCGIATGFLLSSASSTNCLYDCSSLSVRRRTILLGRSYHRICCCKYQSRSEISWVNDRRSATHAVVIWRPLCRDGRPECVNKLPSHLLRLMQSADTFRRHLKTFFLNIKTFHQAFISWQYVYIMTIC